MSALVMRQFVRDDESHGRLALLHRELEHIGVDHDEAAAEEARGERVQDAAGLDDVDIGRLRQSQRLGVLLDLTIYEGQLLCGNADAVPTDASKKHPVHAEECESSEHA